MEIFSIEVFGGYYLSRVGKSPPPLETYLQKKLSFLVRQSFIVKSYIFVAPIVASAKIFFSFSKFHAKEVFGI
jgi:hypothetical protein